MKRLTLLSFVFVAIFSVSPAKAGTYHYTLKDLGTLGGTKSYGQSVNNFGQVAGYSDTASSTHAFLTGKNGVGMTDLGTLYGGKSYAYAVNDAGQVAGTSVSTNGAYNAFYRGANGGPLKDLGGYGGSTEAFGINASGEVAGYSVHLGVNIPSFLSAPNGGTLSYLSTTTFPQSYGQALNTSGQVTGYGYTPGSQTAHAFLSGANGGPSKDLGTLGSVSGLISGGYAVNDKGQVAGFSTTVVNSSFTHAFVSAPNGGALTDIGNFGGAFTEARGINNAGQVVGYSEYSTAAGGRIDAFIYSGGVMKDLNSLIDPKSGFTLGVAYAISDTGYITGVGTNASGQTHAFLLIPTPEPATNLSVLIGLLIGMIAFRFKKQS